MTEILSLTAAASKILQGTTQDICSAENCIDLIIKNLEDKRLNSESNFIQLFEKCKIIMTKLEINITVPRTAKRQTHRSNTPASNPVEYYRRVLYIPILDNVLEDLRMRFRSKKNSTILLLMKLVPISIINMSPEMCDKLINSITENFSVLEINQIAFKGELELWKSKWVSSTIVNYFF